MIPPPIISLVIAACLHSVHGLYQHQIGTLDWYQKNIGSVIYADIYQSSAIVTTSCAVLAAIDTSTSDLIWRQVLPEQEQILGLLTDDESSSIYLVMGSESDPNLSIWSPSDGSLRAITHSFSSLSNAKTTPSPNKMQLCLTSSLVLAWSSSSIHAFDRKTAQIVYTKASPYQIEMITARDRAVNLIDILSRNGSESLIFESVDQNGAIVHSSEVMLDQNTVIPMRGNRALLLSSSLIQDYINGELHDQMIVDEGRLSQLKSVSILNTNLIELCLHSDTRLILDWQQKAFLSAHTIPESIQSEHCSNSVRLYQSSQKLYLYKGRIVLGSIPFDSTEFGLIQSIHCNSSICLISSSDCSLSCIRFGSDDDISLLWTRFEAIATPIQILLVDRDTDQLLASLDQFPILSDRLAIQYQMLKQTLSDSITWLSKMSLSALFSSENALPFDSSTFGMRKLILILTRTRLFALCSLTGQTIWSRSLIPYQLSSTDFIQLFALPQIALIAGRHALTLDSASGEIINEITYSNNVSTAVDYPLSVSPSSSFVSVYFTSNEIGIYPPQLTESVSTLYPYGYRFNQLDQSENGLEGFHTILSVNEWERNLVWRYAFPSDTAVYGWAASNPKEIALNPVLVTADQVLFKYFNRPIRAMLTASGSTLSLLIVDGQTGQVLYRNEHPRCAERREHCHVTVIENVAVYSFYNSRDMLFNIAMVELFHNGPAKAQSFVFPNGIAALGATETRRGITEKHVIVGMDTGQLYLIPLRLYTASSDPSSQPPMIHVNALHIINYDRAVSRMRFIASSSTELESATIIAAAGLDIFTTRSHPSRPFDLLNSDFNFPLLLATVSAVAIGILISSRMALQKQRTLKWL